jgi:murein DD-endopeptidase MepM/ murein hydrolase activator NlpD
MNASSDAYTHVQADPFDGTTLPITYIPDWSKSSYQNKTVRFEDIPISDYIPVPLYDPISLLDTANTSKTSQIIHYTYTTPYMGSYRLNYKENDGSHLWVDIRAPIGTPILAIANGVVIRTVEADATGNKFVVIRHENVPYNGTRTTLYSGYLHLSQIHVTEGKKIRKGDMLGRVGMSGIATTPHLHIQIDTQDAPFHPYWPFSSSESSKAGLWFYDSVNTGLWKENALKYSIHPMTFINQYLWWVQEVVFNSAPAESQSISSSVTQEQMDRAAQLGSFVVNPIIQCQKNRFPDVAEKSVFGKLLYPLVDEKCLFQTSGSFKAKESITYREALILVMDYYKISPTGGTSHFLDIPIGDVMQGYALVAYRRGILDGNYAQPDKILNKEDFADLIVRVAKPEKNPSQMKIYGDVTSMNLHFGSIQDYAFMIKARGGKFAPKTILTRGIAVQMLASIQKQEKQKK